MPGDEIDERDQQLANLLDDHGRLTAELVALRATVAGWAEALHRDQSPAERSGSAWWYAAWKVASRARSDLAEQLRDARERIELLEAEMRSAASQIEGDERQLAGHLLRVAGGVDER